MDTMKLDINGFVLKTLKKGYYAVINKNNKKLVYFDNDLNRCLNMMANSNALKDGADGIELGDKEVTNDEV